MKTILRKYRKKILNVIMILASLVLIDTGIEWFDRMQTEKAYTELALLRHENDQMIPVDSALSPIEPIVSPSTKIILSTKPELPADESVPGKDPIQFGQNPNAPWIAINQDYAGWISISDTRIDYPFVQSNDNVEYLSKDFYGKASKSGTVFMDYRNMGSSGDQHLLLYGHNMKNGSMFHDLVKFHDEGFFSENPYIIISDLYSTRKFQVFSVYEISADDYTLPVAFEDSTAYNDFLQGLTRRSLHSVQLPTTEVRKLLTLITCSYGVGNGRTILHALEISNDKETMH